MQNIHKIPLLQWDGQAGKQISLHGDLPEEAEKGRDGESPEAFLS